MRTHARLEGFHLIDFGMFPRVRYTGYVLFPPEKLVSCVLLVAMIIGVTVAPLGNLLCSKLSENKIRK